MTEPSLAFQEAVNYAAEETLHDISFSMGHAWAQLDSSTCSYIMDIVDGSRGLASRAIDWATEFDEKFAAKLLNDPDCDTYLEDVDSFFATKWAEFMAFCVAERMKE